MKNLDINTPLGQESLKYENIMFDYIKKSWNIEIIITNKENDAVCDGFLVKNNEIIAVFETKCRNLSLEKLESYGSWLITYEKIKRCKLLSEYLKVPFIGFLYLIKDNLTMFWKVTDTDGNYLFDIDHYDSSTQKTINGGTVIRDNAYLSVSYGKFVQSLKLNK